MPKRRSLSSTAPNRAAARSRSTKQNPAKIAADAAAVTEAAGVTMAAADARTVGSFLFRFEKRLLEKGSLFYFAVFVLFGAGFGGSALWKFLTAVVELPALAAPATLLISNSISLAFLPSRNRSTRYFPGVHFPSGRPVKLTRF